MDKIRIQGGHALRGTVQISGSKNAALPVLISSLVSEGNCRFSNVPILQDIQTTFKLLESMGAVVDRSQFHSQNKVEISCKNIDKLEAPYELVKTMRASIVVLGPLLARFGYAKVSQPGGCAIGARPVDFHLKGLEKLGTEIELDAGYIIAKAKKLKGARVKFEFPSVGATENLMMAAALAQGETLLENSACEPEIQDLASVLRKMGVKIEGDGTPNIQIQGCSTLKGVDHEVMADRIEAGTYLAAGLATGGSVTALGIQPKDLESVLAKFEEAGALVKRAENSIEVISQGRPKPVKIVTEPFPGFPTDMQAQFMALCCFADGVSTISETIFENRFMHVPELQRMGADIWIRGNIATVTGKSILKAAPVMATDLRASASLIVAGLAAAGETTVDRIYHLDRGYEKLEQKLNQLGAVVHREKGN